MYGRSPRKAPASRGSPSRSPYRQHRKSLSLRQADTSFGQICLLQPIFDQPRMYFILQQSFFGPPAGGPCDFQHSAECWKLHGVPKEQPGVLTLRPVFRGYRLMSYGDCPCLCFTDGLRIVHATGTKSTLQRRSLDAHWHVVLDPMGPNTESTTTPHAPWPTAKETPPTHPTAPEPRPPWQLSFLWLGLEELVSYVADVCLVVCSRIGGCRGPQSVDENKAINLLLPTRIGITVRLNIQYALEISSVLNRLPSPGYTLASRRIYLDILLILFLILQGGELFRLYLEVSCQNMVGAYPKWSLGRPDLRRSCRRCRCAACGAQW